MKHDAQASGQIVARGGGKWKMPNRLERGADRIDQVIGRRL